MRVSKSSSVMLAYLALATLCFAQRSTDLHRLNGDVGAPNASASSATTTFVTLVDFDGTNGQSPSAALVQSTDGNLYGTTEQGGANGGYGTVYKIAPNGALTTLYDFCQYICGTDGDNLFAPLVFAANGSFYGTSYGGGANNSGTVFEVTPSGSATLLYSFCSQPNCVDGSVPSALVQAANGNFYGTTAYGGTYFQGNVFKISTAGQVTTLYSFCAQTGCPDGSRPFTGLALGSDGNFYGTTSGGGKRFNAGTVFKITPQGVLTTLHSFNGNDGSAPVAALIQANDGSFYGTTEAGGTNSAGTVFKIASQGKLTTLYSFCSQINCTDGSEPLSSVIQATDGNFYGTTYYGGDPNCAASFGCGTLFQMTPAGTLTTLHTFEFIGDGAFPRGGLLQATNGNFYGTTEFGGTGNPGTVFGLSVGLGPFVHTTTASGRVGSKVVILGTNLKGATSVTFNGVPATFTVASGNYITATVPAGASTGPVVVTMPLGPLTSDRNFTVLK